MKLESKLHSNHNGYVKLNYLVPLENKHFLEAELQGDCDWHQKHHCNSLQLEWAPCDYARALFKVSHTQLWKSHAQFNSAKEHKIDVLTNLVASHPDFKWLAVGFESKKHWVDNNWKITAFNVGAQLNVGNGYFLANQAINVNEKKMGHLNVSWHNQVDKDTEMGASANISHENLDVEFGVQKKVQWTEKLLNDRELNLHHTFKAVVNKNGGLKVLVQKALTNNLKLNLTSHLDLHHLEAFNGQNLGIGLV